jgi:DNA-binding IclR family transcriptional regulator
MSGVDRYIAALKQFDEHHAVRTVQELADSLGVPASTVYRTVRDLVRGGFLARASEGRYRLGTAFIEFDRVLRLTDPLVRHGQVALQDFVAHVDIDSVGLLCSLYADHVMCVANAVAKAPTFSSSYERGRPMPVVRGATSKVILAQLPTRQLNKLLGRHVLPQAVQSPQELRAELSLVKKQGFCISRGEIDEGLVGIAVPIIVPSSEVIASISIVVAEKDLNDVTERRLIMMLITSASLLIAKLREDEV